MRGPRIIQLSQPPKKLSATSSLSTYRLTPAIVATKCAPQQLVPWLPTRPGAFREVRTVFLHHEVATLFNANPWPRDRLDLDDDPSLRRRQFHAVLQGFITGRPLLLDLELKLLKPISAEFADLWEFRSMPPDPQTRLLGFFAAPGCFVGLWFGLRRDLGDKNDIRWSNAAKICRQRFALLFPGAAPMPSAWPISGRAGLRSYTDE